MAKANALFNGVQWNGWSAILATAVQFILLALLARYTDAEAIGALMLAWIVIRLTQPWIELGLSNAIIHAEALKTGELSFLWRLQIGLGLVLFTLLWTLGAWFWSWGSGNDLAWKVVQIMSLTLLIAPWALTHISWLKKQMRFDDLGKIQCIGYLAEFIVGLSLILSDWGVLSLAWAYVARYTVITIGVLFREKNLQLSLEKVSYPKDVVQFAVYDFSSFWINQFSQQVDRILISQFLGLQALAWYGMAWDLIISPLAKIGGVLNNTVYPFLSRVRSDMDRFQDLYDWSLRLILFISLPLLIIMTVYSLELVQLVYGTGWEPVANILPWMCLLAYTKVLAYPGGPVFLALGQPKFLLNWNIIWTLSLTAVLAAVLYLYSSLHIAVITLAILSLLFVIVWMIALSKRLSTFWASTFKLKRQMVSWITFPAIPLVVMWDSAWTSSWWIWSILYLIVVAALLWTYERRTILAQVLEKES